MIIKRKKVYGEDAEKAVSKKEIEGLIGNIGSKENNEVEYRSCAYLTTQETAEAFDRAFKQYRYVNPKAKKSGLFEMAVREFLGLDTTEVEERMGVKESLERQEEEIKK